MSKSITHIRVRVIARWHPLQICLKNIFFKYLWSVLSRVACIDVANRSIYKSDAQWIRRRWHTEWRAVSLACKRHPQYTVGMHALQSSAVPERDVDCRGDLTYIRIWGKSEKRVAKRWTAAFRHARRDRCYRPAWRSRGFPIPSNSDRLLYL